MDLMRRVKHFEVIEYQQWVPLMVVKENWRESMIREFYLNLEDVTPKGSEDLVVRSMVNGKQFTLSASEICNILGIPCDGSKVYKQKVWPKNLSKRAVLKFLKTDPYAAPQEEEEAEIVEEEEEENVNVPELKIKQITRNEIPVEYRIIHKIIADILFPRTGHNSGMSWMDIYVLYMLEKKQKMNYGHMMIVYMLEIPSSLRGLPYCNFLGTIFKKKRVPDKGDKVLKPKKGHEITYPKLLQMKIRWSQSRDKWVEFQGSAEEAEHEDLAWEGNINNADAGAAAAGGEEAVSLESIRNEMRANHRNEMEALANLRNLVIGLTVRVEGLEKIHYGLNTSGNGFRAFTTPADYVDPAGESDEEESGEEESGEDDDGEGEGGGNDGDDEPTF